MGVLLPHKHKLYNPGIGVMTVSYVCAWIWISAMSQHVYAEGNQTLVTVTTQASSGISATKAEFEATMGITDSNSNTSAMTTIATRTNVTEVNNRQGATTMKPNPNKTFANGSDSNSTNITNGVDTDTREESTPDMATTYTSDNSSSQSAESTPKLSTQIPLNETETIISTRSEVIENQTPTEAATTESLDSTSVTATETSFVTNSSEISTKTCLNTSQILEVDHTTRVRGLNTLGFLIIICVAVTAVVAVILVVALFIYFSRDRCCQPNRQIEEEYVDCDHELYTALNLHTNFRHHGARAEYQPLNLKDEKLITKMEIDEADDDNCTNNTVVNIDRPTDSGRYLNAEGLVYVTPAHDCNNGKARASNIIHKDDTTVQYSSVDIHKTNKLFERLQKRENSKKKKAASKKKVEKRK